MANVTSSIHDFQITVGEALQEFTRIPLGGTNVLYHYTTRAGLEGILRDGGLRATFRGRMNDSQEFTYARQLIDEVFSEIGQRPNVPSLTVRLMGECSANLDRNMSDFHGSVRAFCSCLTFCRDQESQWRDYADQGNGFALGFDLFEIARISQGQLNSGQPWLICMPVVYDRNRQRGIIEGIIEAAMSDMNRFKTHVSTKAEDLTAFYRRVLLEAVTMLVTCIDFIKHPNWKKECEMRIIAEPNDGTFDVRGVRHLESDGIPFLFHDLRDPATGRLPLKEIVVGPNAASQDAVSFVERFISDMGIHRTGGTPPRIVRSSLSRWT